MAPPRLHLVVPETTSQHAIRCFTAICAAGDVASALAPGELVPALAASAVKHNVALLSADEKHARACDGMEVTTRADYDHARKLLGSDKIIGGLAGILLTFDGLEFVLSRTALLDIFLAFFVVAAVACLVADREWFRNRLARYLEQREISDLAGRFGPALIVRPWRIAAGVCFGLALGSNTASAGLLRLPNDTFITARNAANNADINLIKVDSSNLVSFGANTADFGLGGDITANGHFITSVSIW